MRPKIKICGLTSPEEARLAATLGADFLGLNFYPPSPRSVEPERAVEIARAARAAAPGVRLVGVFVNRPRSEVEEIERAVGLDLLQFHGDETARDLQPFARRAIKVVRVRERFEPALLDGYGGVWGALIDFRHSDLYGGSGRSWDFSSLAGSAVRLPRVFIAGGLGPGNVRAAVAAARPYAVDLCSGVEARPGVKDPALVRRLFEEIDHVESPPAA